MADIFDTASTTTAVSVVAHVSMVIALPANGAFGHLSGSEVNDYVGAVKVKGHGVRSWQATQWRPLSAVL